MGRRDAEEIRTDLRGESMKKDSEMAFTIKIKTKDESQHERAVKFTDKIGEKKCGEKKVKR